MMRYIEKTTNKSGKAEQRAGADAVKFAVFL
jgi:hypothetical protein